LESSEANFIEQHLTNRNRERFLHLKQQLTGGRNVFDSIELSFFRRYFESVDPQEAFGAEADSVYLTGEDRSGNPLREVDVTKALMAYENKHNGNFDPVIVAYGKSMLLPYFKRFAPQGYDALLASMQNGEVDIVSLVEGLRDGRNSLRGSRHEGVFRYLSYSAQRDWSEESDEFDGYLNPNYSPRSDAGYEQPRRDMYRNDAYYDFFGIVNGAPSRNQSYFDLITEFRELKRAALEQYGEENRSQWNLYELPQISKTWTQKTLDAVSKRGRGKTFVNALKDLFTTRIDDPLYGQDQDLLTAPDGNRDMMVMPKYYLGALEDVSDVSVDLAYSYSMLIYQAAKYQANMDALGDVTGLWNDLQSRRIKNGQMKDSNVYHMFREWVDYHFYGRRMNKKITFNVLGAEFDAGKFINVFTNMARLANIGFSPVVSLTAMTTNAANLALERAVRQYVDRDSFSRATKESLKMAGDYWSEYGSAYRKSKLYAMGEHFGAYQFRERVRNSGYGKVFRSMKRLLGPYGLMDMLNSPFAPQVMNSVLMGYRYVDGRFVSYSQFGQRPEFAGRKAGDVRSEWKKYEKTSLWDCVHVENGLVEYRSAFGAGRKAMEQAGLSARNEIVSLIQKCDGTISPEHASTFARSYLTSGLVMHRGWLTMAIQRRWGNQWYNFSTNQMERGSYNSLGALVRDSFRGVEEKNLAGLIRSFRENWHDLDMHDRRNLHRLAVDAAAFAGMVALMMVFAGMSDDDDNEDSWMVQLMSYIGLRTVSEMLSQNEPFLFVNTVEALKNPIVPLRQATELINLKNWSQEEVQSGTYKGRSKMYRMLARQTWLRHYHQLQNGQSIHQTGSYFRLMNRWTLFAAQK
jgi:hypothetical protein